MVSPMDHGYDEDDVERLCEICCQLFKYNRVKQISDVVLTVIRGIYSTVVKLSPVLTEDLAALKAECDANDVQYVIQKENVCLILEKLVSMVSDFGKNDTGSLISSFLAKARDEEGGRKREAFLNQFNDLELEKLTELGVLIADAEEEGHVGLTESVHKLLESVKPFCQQIARSSGSGLDVDSLKKAQLDEALTMIKSAASVPEDLRDTIEEYLHSSFAAKFSTLDIRASDAASFKRLGRPTAKHILLMGDPGAGRKTFINSLQQYLQHETLHDAVSCAEPLSVACTVNFDIFSDDFNEVHVLFTPDDFLQSNSDNRYSIQHDDLTLHFTLVDLAPDQVARVADNNLDEVDLVLVFIKATDTAVPNLVQALRRVQSAACPVQFVVTHSRASEFRVGLSISVLDSVRRSCPGLARDAVYCIDNEGFCFLCGYKTDRGLMSRKDEHTKRAAAISWHTSRTIMFNMLQQIIQ